LFRKILAFLPHKRRKARCLGNKGKEKKKKKKVKSLEEFEGVAKSNRGNKLHSSLTQGDQKTVDKGKLLQALLDQGMSSFMPDLMMEKFLNDYKLAKQIYGESLLRYLGGYDPNYVKKNLKIPEFQRELMEKMREKVRDLKSEGMINSRNEITDEGLELASLVLYVEEIKNLMPKGIVGERFHKQNHIYGERNDVKIFKKSDRYRDLAIRKSIKSAIRRNHKQLFVEDMKSFERSSKGKIYVIYALDSSGSMKGEKIAMCKKAGIALAFKAIEEKDMVGLMVFGKEVKQQVMPTNDFMMLLREMTKIRACSETDLATTIKQSVEMFPETDVTRHLIILTDAMPTVGDDPEGDTIAAANIAAANKITISLIGINLNKKTEKLAKTIVDTTNGRLYIVKDVKEIDRIVLEDYYGL
jgi:Mg-chelatase subunit ChlD